MDADEQRRADALERYWDAVQRGEAGAQRPPEIGDLTHRLIARLHARRATPDLDPARERVWQDLRRHVKPKEPDMDATLYPPGTRSVPISRPESNGRVKPAPVPGRTRSFAGTRRWLATTAATAILLLVTLAAIYFVLIAASGHHSAAPDGVAPVVDWPTFRGNPGHTGATTDPGITGTPQILWTFTARRGFTPPVIVAGIVYALSNDGVVHALDAATGSERWSFAMGVANDVAFAAYPTAADELVFVGSADGTLYALDAATGTKRWAVQTGGAIQAPAVVVDGSVYIGSTDGFLYALAADTGEERWRYATGPISLSSSSAPAVDDGVVYISSDDLTLYAIDAATGKERWHLSVAGTKPRTPVVAGGTVYATGDGVGVVAMDAGSGTERWHFAATGSASPTVSGGTAYVPSDNEVYALDAATGAVRWHTGVANPTSLAIAGETVYGSGTRGLFALDAATGALRWQLPTVTSKYPPAIAGGVVFIGGSNGVLAAVGSGAGTPAS